MCPKRTQRQRAGDESEAQKTNSYIWRRDHKQIVRGETETVKKRRRHKRMSRREHHKWTIKEQGERARWIMHGRDWRARRKPIWRRGDARATQAALISALTFSRAPTPPLKPTVQLCAQVRERKERGGRTTAEKKETWIWREQRGRREERKTDVWIKDEGWEDLSRSRSDKNSKEGQGIMLMRRKRESWCRRWRWSLKIHYRLRSSPLELRDGFPGLGLGGTSWFGSSLFLTYDLGRTFCLCGVRHLWLVRVRSGCG